MTARQAAATPRQGPASDRSSATPGAASASVMTVLGPVSAADLGIVLPHEHLLCRVYRPADQGADERFHERVTLGNLGWVRQHWASNADNLRLTSERLAIQELQRFKDAGGGTLVDLTQDGIGRSPAALARISRATGVHIVMGCGAYVAPTNPAWIATATTGAIADRLVAEANGGVGPARIRPGIIGEIGCSWPLEAVEGRVLVAAALAQARTGLAISVHPGRHRAAPPQIVERLAAAGADLSRVVIGHLDRTVQDLAGLVEIARSGPYVELDLFGLETSYYPWPGVAEGLSDARRLILVRGLIEAGLGDRILLSHDICTKHRLARYGGHGYDHLVSNVLPWMRDRGFDEAEIDLLFRTNPATMLGSHGRLRT